MAASEKMTIGDLAQQADVIIEAIRSYESTRLLRQPAKPARGWRR